MYHTNVPGYHNHLCNTCRWLHQHGDDSGEDAEEETLDEDEDNAACMIDNYNRVDIYGGTEGVADEDVFDVEWKTRVLTSIKVFQFWYNTI